MLKKWENDMNKFMPIYLGEMDTFLKNYNLAPTQSLENVNNHISLNKF